MLFYFTTVTTSILVQQFEEKLFLSWMRNNNQFYRGDEYHFRLGRYLSNLKIVQRHNKAKKNFKVSLNKFATITHAEYKMLLGEMSCNYKSKLSKSNPKKRFICTTSRIKLEREKGC